MVYLKIFIKKKLKKFSSKMLIPIFSLQLNNKVFPRTFSVGKFNGKRSCLVGATAGNKVEI